MSGGDLKSMRDVFLERIHAAMRQHDDIFLVSDDFGSRVLDKIRADFGDRFINVGIAEQNCINVAAGLALEGFNVYAYGIACFMSMRSFEQIRVNVAMTSQLRPMNLNIVGVGAGMSYDVSGPTHHCLEDLSIIRTLPHIELHSPSDATVAAAMVDGALDRAVPKYFRFDGKPLPILALEVLPAEVARGFRVLRAGRFLILSTGYMTHKALKVAAAMPPGSVGVVDLTRFRPLDRQALAQALAGAAGVMTLEEGFLGAGGLDALAATLLREAGLAVPLCCQGIRDRYLFEVGGREALHTSAGLSVDALCNAIRQALSAAVEPS